MSIPKTCDDHGICQQFGVTLDDESMGIIQRKKRLEEGARDKQGLMNAIAKEISL